MSEAADLYETDFALWAETQARALRDPSLAGVNVPVDWANVAEEIESLSRSDRRRLGSRLQTIIEHLLKLRFSPSVEPRGGWRETIGRSRREIASLLRDSPSLRRELTDLATAVWPDAIEGAVESLEAHGEAEAARRVRVLGKPFDLDRVLDSGFLPGRDGTPAA